jgi:hypothetical protein
MFQALKNLSDSEHPYDCEDFSKQCQEEFTCCVPIKPNERNDRFCNFTGVSEETDYLDCGYTGEEDMKNDKESKISRVSRYIRWGLIIQIVFWGCLGAVFVTHPEVAQFDIMMSDEYVNTINTQSYRHFQIEDEHAKERAMEQPGYILSSLLNTMDVSSILSKLSNPPAEVTPSDKEKFITHTSEIVEGLVKHAVKSSIATPARMIGVFFLYYAVISLYFRTGDIKIETFNAIIHIIWACASLFCCVVASSSASRNFIFALGAFNLCMLILWIMIDKKLTQIKSSE